MLERDVPLVPTFNINFALMERIAWAGARCRPGRSRRCATCSSTSRPTSATPWNEACGVVMGTDSFAGMYPPAELAYMSEFGLGPFRAIQAATSEAAKLLGLASEVGTLRSRQAGRSNRGLRGSAGGARLWRDPTRIVLVMQGGRVVADRRGG